MECSVAPTHFSVPAVCTDGLNQSPGLAPGLPYPLEYAGGSSIITYRRSGEETMVMPSAFPGMDPYLEAPAQWPGVHQRLITYTADALQSSLRPRYQVLIGERVYIAE